MPHPDDTTPRPVRARTMGLGGRERSLLLGVDWKALRDLEAAAPLLRANAERIVDSFHRRMVASPLLAEVISRFSTPERQRDSMLRYIRGIPDSRFDAAHVVASRRIAEVHHSLGVPVDAYQAQLAILREEWTRIVLETSEEAGRGPDENTALIAAVDRVISFDEGIVTLYFTDALDAALQVQDQYELIRETTASIFAGSLDSSETLETVVEAARRALGADVVRCYVHSRDGARVEAVVSTGDEVEDEGVRHVGSGDASGMAVLDLLSAPERPVVWCDDLTAAGGLPDELREWLGGHGAVLGARIDHVALEREQRGRLVLGTLFAGWRQPRVFGHRDEISILNLAGLAGVALANERMLDVRRDLELELRQAQKMEAVGQLAAGVAHEINTPVQFVGDSAQFLAEAFGDLQALLSSYRAVVEAAATGTAGPETLEQVAELEEDLDLEFLEEQIPRAIERTLEGTKRVAEIVRAMKEFAHPRRDEQAPADLNRAVLNTLTVAANELKYVADVETDLGDLPPVTCHVGDINQVMLNLVVNAAHAIGDVLERKGRGVIRVSTAMDDDGGTAVIRVADTGSGIPEEIRGRVFDPFFTTKEVGRGTGQGLAIAYALIHERHGGTIAFETATGEGTTFEVRLPVAGLACPGTRQGRAA